METFTETQPSAHEVLRVAHEGGPEAGNALARTWISEGIPAAFEKCPAVYDSMRAWLANELGVHAKEIGLTGSARFGSSFTAKKEGRPFGPYSDLDLFVVSEALFSDLCSDFYAWREDYRAGRAKARSKGERRYWPANATEVPQGIKSRGLIDVFRIPSHTRYRTAQRALSTMYALVLKLRATPCAPSPKRASVRCYKDWDSMVGQMALNLVLNAQSMMPRRLASQSGASRDTTVWT